MSEYTIKTVSGSVVRFDDAEDGLPLTNCEVDIVPKIETGTASGSVVAFSDGADDVPIKSANFEILSSGGGGTPSAPVSIVGKSNVTVYQTGKNLFDFAGNINSTSGGITFTALSDGGISYTGTATGTWCYMTPKVNFFIPKGTQLTFSRNQSLGYRHYLNIGYDDGGTRSLIIDDTSVTYTLPKNVVALRLVMSQLTAETSYSATVYFMLEVGAVSSTFQKCESKTPISVALGQTVYGGTLAENGTLTITHELLSLDGSENWQRSGTYNGSFYYDTETNHIFSSGNSLCSHLIQAHPFPSNYASGKFGLNGAQFQFLNIWIMPADSTVEELKTYLQTQYNNGTPVQVVLELATPIVITGLDEISISTYLGYNALWSDSDLEMTYYKNGYNTKTVSVLHYGKNFIDDNLANLELGTILSSTGKNTNSTNRVRNTNYTYFPLDKIFSSYILTIPDGYKIAMRFYKEDKTFVPMPSWAQGFINHIPQACVGQGIVFARFVFAKTDDSNITPQEAKNVGFQLEVGSTATAYEPYIELITSTSQLERTIYGGPINLTKGTGISQFKKVNLGSLAWVKYQNEGHFYSYSVTDLWYPAEGGISRYGTGVSDAFEFVQASPNEGQINAYFNTSYHGYRIFVKKEDFASKTSAEFKAYLQEIGAFLIYKVDEQTEEPFTFTPIHLTSHSSNTLWSTEGDITVSYYSYIETDGRYLISGSTLTDIADAIREKTSIVGPINVNDFVVDIMTIDDSAPDAEEVEF